MKVSTYQFYSVCNMGYTPTVVQGFSYQTKAAMITTEGIMARGYLTTILSSIKCRAWAS
tara:strand:+ start:177 stop:353 length:177 start_codon:yes stop_codon:yes gene_type:complete